MASHNAVQASNGVYKLQALDRAFAVLDLLSSSSAPMGLAEIAAALDLHKSTAHRFLMVLERHRVQGLRLVSRITQNGWNTLILRKR